MNSCWSDLLTQVDVLPHRSCFAEGSTTFTCRTFCRLFTRWRQSHATHCRTVLFKLKFSLHILTLLLKITYLVDECFSFSTNCKAITVVCHYSLMNCMLQEFKASLFRFAFHLRMKDLDKPLCISGLKSKKISLILLTLQKGGSDLRALIIGYQDCATYVGFWIISRCASSISRVLILSLLGSLKHL